MFNIRKLFGVLFKSILIYFVANILAVLLELFLFEHILDIDNYSMYFEYISVHLIMFLIVLVFNLYDKKPIKENNYFLNFKIFSILTFIAILLTFLIDYSMVLMRIYNIDFHIVNIFNVNYFIVIIIVLFSAFVEEYIFRKVLMIKLCTFNTNRTSIKIVGFSFALLHLLGSSYSSYIIFIVSFLYYYLISITLSHLLLITKSFWGIVGFHFGHNIMVLSISSYGISNSIYPFEWSNSTLRYSLGSNAGILNLWNSMTSWIVILLLVNYLLDYLLKKMEL